MVIYCNFYDKMGLSSIRLLIILATQIDECAQISNRVCGTICERSEPGIVAAPGVTSGPIFPSKSGDFPITKDFY